MHLALGAEEISQKGQQRRGFRSGRIVVNLEPITFGNTLGIFAVNQNERIFLLEFRVIVKPSHYTGGRGEAQHRKSPAFQSRGKGDIVYVVDFYGREVKLVALGLFEKLQRGGAAADIKIF
jgi:hypothetical protein